MTSHPTRPGCIELQTIGTDLPTAWALGRLGPGQSMLVLRADDADAAGIEALHRAVAETFVTRGRVSFFEDVDAPTLGERWRRLWQTAPAPDPAPDSVRDRPGEADTQQRRITLPRSLGTLAARVAGGTAPRELGLSSTRNAEAAQRLFAFSGWFHGAQLVLLSAADAPAPRVDDALLCRLALDKDWRQLSALPRDQGIAAVAFPGVDGALIGIIALEDGAQGLPALADALGARLAAQGLRWCWRAGDPASSPPPA